MVFPHTADAVVGERALVRGLAARAAVVLDGAILLWDETASAPRTRQLANLALHEPSGTTFWSLLLGLTVTLRLLGEDTPASALEQVGVESSLVCELRDTVRPGTSVIFLLTREPVDDELTDGLDAVVHRAALTAAQDATWHQVFRP